MIPSTPNSSQTTSIFKLTTHTIPILSPFLFIPSLYALSFNGSEKVVGVTRFPDESRYGRFSVRAIQTLCEGSGIDESAHLSDLLHP